MRLSFTILLGLCLMAGCRSAEEDYEYEDEPAPAPVTPAPSKPAGRLGGLLSPRARAPVGRKATPASTTPKPVEQPVEEEFDEGEEVVDENQEPEETSTTTTEATKKLRAGGVRPFRSNEDLLAALKRRRAEVGTHKKEHPTTQTSADSSTSKSKASGRKNNESTTRAPARGRFGGSTRGKNTEEVQETQHEEIQVKPKPYRRG
ncbi:uncharacterized protein LOC107041050 [Diachasma alloeum]|uniref:uncharacterized protein LOC107041050 n=1 Tax=Diachasma alloeum TaxID=454923 RepID=UPI0007382EFA|nr:uncharacterized protein LOC107041050 [Diachasma alloeum]